MNAAAPAPSPRADGDAALTVPTFAEAFRFWLKLGFISFGGPAGQIAIMQSELVEKRRWIGHDHFLHALNFCMLLPGPEAQQLATYIGWLLHRTRGGLVAGILFVLPSVVILWALSWIYVACGQVPWIAAIFYGLKPAVMAIVAAAVIRIGRKSLRSVPLFVIAVAAFIAISVFHIPFPFVIASAALSGLLLRQEPSAEKIPRATQRPSLRRTIGIGAAGVAIWWLPILLLGAWQGWDGTLFREGVFFSKAAVVTFGGAYAVLPYVAQQAVETHGWLQTGQMMDGLGLAETTPGPLIMVLQFVGFLGAWHQPGTLPPLAAATLGAFITTWATFVPCFLWIFLGAPYLEQLRGYAPLRAALSAVTAAVVGVILNLALWFGWHVIFPSGHAVDWFSLGLSAVAFAALVWGRWSLVAVILASGAAGLMFRILW